MKVIKYLPILAICCMATGCNSKKEAVLTSGIDLANLDTTALPGTSFYQYACGGWMKNHPLTDEYSRFGSFDMLAEIISDRLKKQSQTKINKGKLVMDHKKHKVFWNRVALHLTRQEYNFLYLLAVTPMRVYTFEQIYQLVWKDYSVGDIKNIIWCLVKRLRKKLNAVEDGAGNCIVSVRDIGYKFELNKENEQQ